MAYILYYSMDGKDAEPLYPGSVVAKQFASILAEDDDCDFKELIELLVDPDTDMSILRKSWQENDTDGWWQDSDFIIDWFEHLSFVWVNAPEPVTQDCVKNEFTPWIL